MRRSTLHMRLTNLKPGCKPAGVCTAGGLPGTGTETGRQRLHYSDAARERGDPGDGKCTGAARPVSGVEAKSAQLARNPHPLHKKIAILGGSTTNEVADQLGLFLLQYGIEAEFYQSEYAQYWQDAMFGTPELDDFHPDVIYIHTNWRNLTALPTTADSEAAIDAMLDYYP